MIQVYKIDNQGFYIEPVLVEDINNMPNDHVRVMPEGLYKPKWDGFKWIEGLSQIEIDNIVNAPVEKPTIEELQAQINELQEQLNQLINQG